MKKLLIYTLTLIITGCGITTKEIPSETSSSNKYEVIQPSVILEPSEDHSRFDTDYLGMPRVIYVDGKYYLFYAGCKAANQEGREMVGLATSYDGNTWERIDCDGHNKSIFKLGKYGDYDYSRIWGSGTILIEDGLWKMWLVADGKPGNKHNGRVGYATSNDGKDWEKYQGQYNGAIFDDSRNFKDGTNGINTFIVFKYDDKYAALYSLLNGNEVRLAFSDNGIDWDEKGLILHGMSVDSVIQYGDRYIASVSTIDNEIILYETQDLRNWEKLKVFRVPSGYIWSGFLMKNKEGGFTLFYAHANSNNPEIYVNSGINICVTELDEEFNIKQGGI